MTSAKGPRTYRRMPQGRNRNRVERPRIYLSGHSPVWYFCRFFAAGQAEKARLSVSVHRRGRVLN